jgi:hypothetical protein
VGSNPATPTIRPFEKYNEFDGEPERLRNAVNPSLSPTLRTSWGPVRVEARGSAKDIARFVDRNVDGIDLSADADFDAHEIRAEGAWRRTLLIAFFPSSTAGPLNAVVSLCRRD